MKHRSITVTTTAIAAIAAVVANLIIFAIASAAGATWEAGAPYPIGVPMVVLFSILPLLIAAVVVAMIAKRFSKFQRIAAWLGLAFALVTIAGSLTMAPQLVTGISLGAMHITTGAAWFYLSYPGKTQTRSHAQMAHA